MSKAAPPAPVNIASVSPLVDGGATPLKRVVGDVVALRSVIVAPIPQLVGAELCVRAPNERKWSRVPLSPDPLEPDVYNGQFRVDQLGRWEYKIEAWVDRAGTWRDELRRRVAAGQGDLDAELADGKARLGVSFHSIEDALASTVEVRSAIAASAKFIVEVDRERAQFGAWYELFPRSFGGLAGVTELLPRLSEIGIDVVYLPPIHPIGNTNRKGRNNSLIAGPEDPGSPWAIGSADGGHCAINPEIGNFEDFDRLIARARDLEMDIALDFALQCSPDHPWLKEHPEWFAWRPDGTIRYAENPPKRYEDIVNFNFETKDWRNLWDAILDVVRFWVARGVRAFRVDNPHTKPLELWRWLIAEVRKTDPDVFFLAEAFTRPAVMAALAKAGFSQSYTYFTWRNTAVEIGQYVNELARSAEYFRPNFFVNTPDILTHYLQSGGEPAFRARLVLASMLGPSYGVYSGFENIENVALHESSEEYLDSEKYEVKKRELDGELLPLMAQLNSIRRSSSLFRHLDNARVLNTANDQIFGVIKSSPEETILICVNLDPHSSVEGLIDVPRDCGLPYNFSADDLLSGARFYWYLGGNYVRLEPGGAHILKLG